MESSLSNLVSNLAKRTHKVKCKHGNDKKSKACRIKYKDCECCLEYKNVKNNLIKYKCLWCNKNYQKTFDESLKKTFANTYKFAKHDINQFFNCFEKVFTHVNTWMIAKNPMKHHCQKKKIFTIS